MIQTNIPIVIYYFHFNYFKTYNPSPTCQFKDLLERLNNGKHYVTLSMCNRMSNSYVYQNKIWCLYTKKKEDLLSKLKWYIYWSKTHYNQQYLQKELVIGCLYVKSHKYKDVGIEIFEYNRSNLYVKDNDMRNLPKQLKKVTYTSESLLDNL